MKHMTRKATPTLIRNENLIFEKSSPGKGSVETAATRCPGSGHSETARKSERKDLGHMRK